MPVYFHPPANTGRQKTHSYLNQSPCKLKSICGSYEGLMLRKHYIVNGVMRLAFNSANGTPDQMDIDQKSPL